MVLTCIIPDQYHLFVVRREKTGPVEMGDGNIFRIGQNKVRFLLSHPSKKAQHKLDFFHRPMARCMRHRAIFVCDSY